MNYEVEMRLDIINVLLSVQNVSVYRPQALDGVCDEVQVRFDVQCRTAKLDKKFKCFIFVRNVQK